MQCKLLISISKFLSSERKHCQGVLRDSSLELYGTEPQVFSVGPALVKLKSDWKC